MSDIAQLEDTNVPLIARAWIHNGEILGVTREGTLLLIARIVGEPEDSVFNPIPESSKKPRSRKKKVAPTISSPSETATSQDEE
jgi:hypothetical protein